MAEIKLSIIIPVYNVEKYLEECYESIKEQLNDSCEVIFVDDGSTDTSGKICDDICETQFNARVIHQENKGLGGARNSGLNVSTGKYVVFLDADDRISFGAISQLLSWIDNTDAELAFLNAIKFYPDGSSETLGDCIYHNDLVNLSRGEIFEYLSSRPKYPGSACTKIYRREFLLNNNLIFPSDRRLSEDLGFVRDCLLLANKFDALDIPYYEYRQQREGSITNTQLERRIDDLSLFIEESVSILCENGRPKDKFAKCILSFVAYEYAILLMLFGRLSKTNKNNKIELLRKNSWVLKYAKSKSVKLIYLFRRVFGIKLTSYFINIYKKD